MKPPRIGWKPVLLLPLLALAGCAEPGGPDEPIVRGVVLVSLDALGAGHVGAYGYERPTTPALDALAEEGALFERAYTQQFWTLTAHITMMTGLYVRTHGASALGPVRAGVVTLAELLSRAGFATAAYTGAGGYMKPGFGLGRGFDVYGTNRSIASGGSEPRQWLRAQSEKRREDPEHRFFLFLHYYDVHSDAATEFPYEAPERYRRVFFPDGVSWRRTGDTKLLMRMQAEEDYDEVDREVLRGLYDAEVLHADQERLAPLLRLLDALGLADDTLLIVTSDHGEEIFEHGKVSHQQPYEEVARVPLVLRGPGIEPGARVSHHAELCDLMPSVLDAVGIPIPESVQGESLLPLIRGAEPRTRGAHVDGMLKGRVRGPSALVVDLDGVPWSYVHDVTDYGEGGTRAYSLLGPPELYRLDRDPRQRHNLAASEPELAERLGSELLAWFRRNEVAGRALGPARFDAKLLSEEEQRQLRALGYVEDRIGTRAGARP